MQSLASQWDTLMAERMTISTADAEVKSSILTKEKFISQIPLQGCDHLKVLVR